MGGGAMRTAAKAAALGGYRSVGSFADQATAAARRATRAPSAAVHAPAPVGESGPMLSTVTSEKVQLEAPPALAAQWPAWEINDWEFAGGKEEEHFDSIPPGPRFVFGPVPTMEEAKEATCDLKEALEKAYFSPNTSEGADKVSQVASSGISAAILPTMPQNVVQAFSLLQGSPEAQTVVASLASDENVWAAVMKNEKVMEFYKKQQSILPPETIVASAESVGSNETPREASANKESSAEGTSESVFTDLVQNIKVKVSEVVSNISDFLQDIMSPPTTGSQSQPNTKTSTSTADHHYMDLGIGVSFMALAIAAILLVLLKRG